jgi:hypothetical protein
VNTKPAAGRDREEFPVLRDRLGEDPARFLDRPLVEPSHQGTSSPFLLAKARIQGIDDREVIRAYRAVERRIDRGPREEVLALLDEREAVLEEIGDRDDRDLGERDPAETPPKDVLIIDENGNPEPYETARKSSASAKVARVREGFEG